MVQGNHEHGAENEWDDHTQYGNDPGTESNTENVGKSRLQTHHEEKDDYPELSNDHVDALEGLARFALKSLHHRRRRDSNPPQRVWTDRDAYQELADHRWLMEPLEDFSGDLCHQEHDEQVSEHRRGNFH